jgi:hypothetical protein
MKIHTDLKLRVVANTTDMPWAPSPVNGIDRKMLERDGDEVARATSLVRYAPNASFTSHLHELGEEFLVLDGVFQDELGQYPAGTYVKNPPGSLHTPFTETGCTLFVKLRYQDPSDDKRVVIHTRSAAWHQGLVPGLSVMAPPTQRLCDGHRVLTSILTDILEVKKSLLLMVFSRMNMEDIPKVIGCAVRT